LKLYTAFKTKKVRGRLLYLVISIVYGGHRQASKDHSQSLVLSITKVVFNF